MRVIPVLIAMLSFANTPLANEAAPYTAEANARLVRVERKMEAPNISSPESRLNVANYLEHLNKLYKRADYDFPKSLEEYYRDVSERNGAPDDQPVARHLALSVAKLHTLMEGLSAEQAFPGEEYSAVRVAYKRMRAVEQGVKLSEEEIAVARKRRADAENAKAEKLQSGNGNTLGVWLFFIGLALIVASLVGFLCSPVWMFFRRKKLAAKERAAPYVYIKKHGHYPVVPDREK